MAQACLKSQDYTLCIETAGKVIKDDPQNPKALYRRGVAYCRTQEFDLAKVFYVITLG